MVTGSDRPVWVGELEVGDSRGSAGELMGVGGRPSSEYGWARVLVRRDGDPVGFVELEVPAGGLTAAQVGVVADAELGARLRAHGGEPGVATAREAERISVVVCTRNRAELLGGCLASLQGLRYGDFEVVVVDNAPRDGSTRARFEELVGTDARFRYVCEPVAGLSRARNRGLVEASSAHVAFTDDDVVVDRWWLHGVVRGFGRDPAVGCVTGLVPSASLDTSAQRYFDQRASWSKGMRPRLYDLETRTGDSALFPFDAGVFGTGANMAVDRDLMITLGGFDEALGAGSPACGGEDLDTFVRIVRAGRVLAYEPSAIVWHRHRTGTGLRRQMHDFGLGLGAYLAKHLADPTVRTQLVRRAPRGVRHMVGRWRDGRRGDQGSAGLVWTELWGIARGPLAYRRGRRAARQGHDPIA